jgi:hypothetical protein
MLKLFCRGRDGWAHRQAPDKFENDHPVGIAGKYQTEEISTSLNSFKLRMTQRNLFHL